MPKTSQALIAVPTFNEAENIETLIAGIRGSTRDIGPFDILVIDDGSPDGTAATVRTLQADDPRLLLLDRGRRLGLGTAYRAGFDHAAEHGHGFVFTMDADLSHNPEHISLLWHEVSQVDVVIGSRYIPGGGILNWSWRRRGLSGTANWLARRLLRMRARDCTSGFRCYRLEILQTVGLDRIRSDGYSYLMEVLFRCQQSGARIREVPIKFVGRYRGKSKISKLEIWKAMVTLVRLRFSRRG